MEPYRQSVPNLDLSIQRHTSAVPDDGYYYVLRRCHVVGRFRGLKQAQARYKELLAEAGYTPPPVQQKKIDPSKEAVERYMDQLEDYWADSSSHRHRGGKTMYRS